MKKMKPVPLLLVMPFYYWLSLCNHTFCVSGLCLDDQKSLLIQFKNNVTIDLWDPSDDDCCAWTGITCDKEGHVTGLDLTEGITCSSVLDNSSSLFSLQHLTNLRVTYTNFSGTLPHSIGNLRYLSKLDLSGCQFNGTLPSSLSNLTELTSLDLSSNKFTGQLPSFGMAKNLTDLDLSYNALSGSIPSSHFEALHNLVRIELSGNSFTGSIPSSLFRLPLLEMIAVSDNQFSQLDDENTNLSSSVLGFLDLSKNNMSGLFPEFIFQLTALYWFNISSNKFHGPMQLHKFWELKNLSQLDVSYNNLSVNIDMKNVDPYSLPNLAYLSLASCNLRTIPDVLRNQSNLQYLDLSHNQIQGIVPNWIWKLTDLQSLDISSNLLTELEGPMNNVSSFSNLGFIDLHNNQLQGPIPILSIQAYYVDYSRNSFSSIIPDSLCYAIIPQVLDLSINNLSGTIPSCLTMSGPYNGLQVLNLRDNNLTGHIPNMSPGCQLTTLNLHGNHLHGTIPKSLASCSKLQLLDLGKNQITGGFPCFLESIPTLRVLVLRNNKFQNSLECGQANNKAWKMLQIVDIAFNNFSGKLEGKYFTNWETMMHHENNTVSNIIHSFVLGGYYQDSVIVINKGEELEYVKIMTVLTSIDFSSNHFEGPIPEELMDLKALLVLNLSNNALSGQIPSSIGNLKQLESLDLSHNSLHGEIPVQLASLTFLSYLNFSFNHLVGKIPTGTQLQSFEASSFEGNDGLHGPPLDVPNATPPGLPPQPACRRLACSVDWNFLSAEMGFTFGLGIFIGPLMFWRKWRIWYWKLVDKILCWIFPQMYLDYVTRGGQWYTILRWWRR